MCFTRAIDPSALEYAFLWAPWRDSSFFTPLWIHYTIHRLRTPHLQILDRLTGCLKAFFAVNLSFGSVLNIPFNHSLPDLNIQYGVSKLENGLENGLTFGRKIWDRVNFSEEVPTR